MKTLEEVLEDIKEQTINLEKLRVKRELVLIEVLSEIKEAISAQTQLNTKVFNFIKEKKNYDNKSD